MGGRGIRIRVQSKPILRKIEINIFIPVIDILFLDAKLAGSQKSNSVLTTKDNVITMTSVVN